MPDQRPQQVRHHQSDKADRAGHGHAATDSECGTADHDQAQTPEINAEAARTFLTQAERIQRPRRQRQQAQPRQHDRRGEAQFGPAGILK